MNPQSEWRLRLGSEFSLWSFLRGNFNLALLGGAPVISQLGEIPDMMSAKISDFLTPSPLSTFGSDLYYEIHATSLTTSAFP